MASAEYISLSLMLAFLALSAFFSSSEAAFLSLQKAKLAHLVNTGVPGASRIASMLDQPERLLATILLGNNLVNVAFTAIVTLIAVDLLGGQRGVIVATVVGTAALLMIGEIIPKSLAVRNSERAVFLYSRPLKWVEIFLWPIVIILQALTRLTQSIFGASALRVSTITEHEIRSLIDVGEAEGEVEPAEAEMLENVFRFGDRQLREVMTPRPEIISIRRGATLKEFLKIYAENSHTRFPVYKETMDNIVGIISAKDVLKAMSSRGIDFGDSVTDVIRDAHFVPETKQSVELFNELRRTGNQMAIAVDEYGGLSGLVTVKRLSEEVVGPVGEEGESPEEEYEHIDDNILLVDGGMSIEEANDDLGINFTEGDYETVAGFVLSELGHIPNSGEQFEHMGLKIEVISMDGLKVQTVRVTKPRATDEQTSNEN